MLEAKGPRDFVDRDLANPDTVNAGGCSFFIGILPFAMLPWLVSQPYGGFEVVVVAIALATGLAWFAFVGWRGWRLLEAHSAIEDRKYDREGKFNLPPEYASSTSATETERQKRSRRSRAKDPRPDK